MENFFNFLQKSLYATLTKFRKKTSLKLYDFSNNVKKYFEKTFFGKNKCQKRCIRPIKTRLDTLNVNFLTKRRNFFSIKVRKRSAKLPLFHKFLARNDHLHTECSSKNQAKLFFPEVRKHFVSIRNINKKHEFFREKVIFLMAFLSTIFLRKAHFSRQCPEILGRNLFFSKELIYSKCSSGLTYCTSDNPAKEVATRSYNLSHCPPKV